MSQETPRYDYQMPPSLSGEDHFGVEGEGEGEGMRLGLNRLCSATFEQLWAF